MKIKEWQIKKVPPYAKAEPFYKKQMKRTKPTHAPAIGIKTISTADAPSATDYLMPLSLSSTFELAFKEDKIGKQMWGKK